MSFGDAAKQAMLMHAPTAPRLPGCRPQWADRPRLAPPPNHGEPCPGMHQHKTDREVRAHRLKTWAYRECRASAQVDSYIL